MALVETFNHMRLLKPVNSSSMLVSPLESNLNACNFTLASNVPASMDRKMLLLKSRIWSESSLWNRPEVRLLILFPFNCNLQRVDRSKKEAP